jgi:gas vesicle protein
MAGFRRSTWFALGLLIGGLVGGAFGLLVASGAASSLRRRGPAVPARWTTSNDSPTDIS